MEINDQRKMTVHQRSPKVDAVRMTREEELRKEGWEKRFTIDEPRLSEVIEQYNELGFEVLLEPVDISSEECTTCIVASRDRFKTIYTRQKSGSKLA